MKHVNLLILVLFFSCSNRQLNLNCNVHKQRGDHAQYEACMLVQNIDDKHYQFSREFQETYDKALEICPHFAHGYREKSFAYLKSGDFITWKELMDKAVRYDTIGNIGYRGWCKYQFFKDYKGAITDFEILEKLMPDIGYSANGNYHLQIAKAICYSALGDKEKAIEIINNQLSRKDYHVGLFDYYQLGVTYYELGDSKNALKAFQQQSQIYEIAENAYYIAKIMKNQGRVTDYAKEKKLALALYKKRHTLNDPYTRHFNKVYLKTIENE